MCQNCDFERDIKERLARENERLARKYKAARYIAGRVPWIWLLGSIFAGALFAFSFHQQVQNNTQNIKGMHREFINTKAEVSDLKSEKLLINHKLETLSADVKDIKGDIKVLIKQTR